MVQTNDPQKKDLTLVVKGYVKKFVTVNPKRVQLRGTTDQPIAKKVDIIPEKEYPFTITESTANKGTDISFALEEKPTANGPGYQLTVKNTRKMPGKYQDFIVLKTDSDIKPELRIRIYGNLTKPRQKETRTPEAAPKQSKTE